MVCANVRVFLVSPWLTFCWLRYGDSLVRMMIITTQIIEQRSLRLEFPWLLLTTLSPDRSADHHLF